MNKIRKIVIIPILVLLLVSNTISANAATPRVEDFVARLYTKALGRSYDEQGLKNWSNHIKRGQATAADVAFSFFISKEFKNRKLDDIDFVDTLYATFFDRKADFEGKRYHLTTLMSTNREVVISSFANSSEFKALCRKYGVSDKGMSNGYKEVYTIPQTKIIKFNCLSGLDGFLRRCYKLALGRAPDKGGLNYWINEITSGRKGAGYVAAAGFLNSKEFIGKFYHDSEFLDVLYRLFLDRGPDASGKKFWQDKLKGGMTRNEVIYGFANSKEFNKIIQDFANCNFKDGSAGAGESQPTIIEVSSISVNLTSITLDVGNTKKITTTVNPSNATNKTITYTSSNTKIATVDKNGNVKGISKGNATITAKSNNGKTATVKITVNVPHIHDFKPVYRTEQVEKEREYIYYTYMCPCGQYFNTKPEAQAHEQAELNKIVPGMNITFKEALWSNDDDIYFAALDHFPHMGELVTVEHVGYEKYYENEQVLDHHECSCGAKK